MDIANLYLPGALAIWAALLFGLAALWGYSLVARGDQASLSFARLSYRSFAWSIGLAALVLLVALARRDFRIEYVYQYSGLELPLRFQLAAFWAGQKGSFLIWLLWGALIGLPLLRRAGRDEAPVMSVYLLTQLGLLFILVRENPFVMLTETPLDGAGLNPLLQDEWMVIHPPIMFVGYALTAVPFAFAIAALLRKTTESWAARAFPWALAGFMVLGTAILLGGYWAYKTLGWGGFWGWDPVENASLIPWLIGTVMIHGLHMERVKKRYRRANLVLACLAYFSVLYGTFLTRSGVLADFSVHSFVDLGISGWLIGLMVFFGLGSLLLLALRLRGVPTGANEDPFLSRGTFMVLSTITIGAIAVLVTVGTSAPLLTRFLPNPGQVGPEFYNRVNMPLAILLAFLLALVPYLTWRGDEPKVLLRKLVGPGIFAVAATTTGVVLGIHQPFHIVFLVLAALALGANLQKTFQKARAGGFRSAGGYLSHVGVGVMLIGILASSAYDQSAKITLHKGVPTTVGDYTLTFTREVAGATTRDGKDAMEIRVRRADGDEYLAYPKLFMNQRTRQVMVNPHIHKLALQDLYISPIEYVPDQTGGGRVQLAKGEAAPAGPYQVKFLGFDLSGVDGDAAHQMASTGEVVVGAVLELTREGLSETVTPTYRFRADGTTDSEAAVLPGGGGIVLTRIDASGGRVELQVDGFGPAAGAPAKLAIDLTRKPLINAVWYGLYVVLFGGILSMLQRAKDLRRLEAAGQA